MTEELTRAIGAMRDLAEQNRTAGNEATQAMAERIAQAAADSNAVPHRLRKR